MKRSKWAEIFCDGAYSFDPTTTPPARGPPQGRDAGRVSRALSRPMTVVLGRWLAGAITRLRSLFNPLAGWTLPPVGSPETLVSRAAWGNSPRGTERVPGKSALAEGLPHGREELSALRCGVRARCGSRSHRNPSLFPRNCPVAGPRRDVHAGQAASSGRSLRFGGSSLAGANVRRVDGRGSNALKTIVPFFRRASVTEKGLADLSAKPFILLVEPTGSEPV